MKDFVGQNSESHPNFGLFLVQATYPSTYTALNTRMVSHGLGAPETTHLVAQKSKIAFKRSYLEHEAQLLQSQGTIALEYL